MMLFVILPGVVFILLMVFLLKLKIFQRLMSSPTPQLTQSVQNSEMSLATPRVKEEERKRGIVCKSRGIAFKPKFKNKQSATKIVYMAHVEESRSVVFFDNLYKTFERDNGHIAPRRLFEMYVPDEERKYNINPPLHCNGLFVLPTRINTILVCNPATKEVITLPESSNRHVARSSLGETVGANKRVGFGFVNSTQAYKVTQFFYRSFDIRERSYSMGFEVFTIGVSSTWRVLDNDPPYPLVSSCTMVTGKCIYFRISSLVREAPKAFLCFNLKSERFSTLLPPVDVEFIDINHMLLSNLQRRVCLSVIDHGVFRVFSYKGGTDDDSDWETRFCFCIQPLRGRIESIAEHKGSVLTRVLERESQKLKFYNSKDRSFEEVDGSSVDAKMVEEGCRLFDGKPWFAVSSYEESAYRLCPSV